MIKKVNRAIKFIMNNLIGRKIIIILIKFLSRSINISLLGIAHRDMGIMKVEDDISGEIFFFNEFLKKNINSSIPTLFDVGANKGLISLSLKNIFPQSKIFSFEPNAKTYFELVENLKSKDIEVYNLGLGSEATKSKLYAYENPDYSTHATMFRDALTDFRNEKIKILTFDFDITTLDEFCFSKGIEDIDFLKIDTEGNELNVLLGAKKLLKEDRIKIILFEFNEMNIISRVFLKDFYDLLYNYKLFRLDTFSLIPIFEYKSYNEIFQFQNIVAINNFYYKNNLNGI